MTNPAMIFVDEITNDLDINTILWLEKELATLTVPIVYVAHDEELLRKTANRILYLKKTDKGSNCVISNTTYDQFISSLTDDSSVSKMVDAHAIEFLKSTAKISEDNIINYSLSSLYKDSKPVARSIGFRIMGSKKIVIMGKDGSGKSALLEDIYTTLSLDKSLKVGFLKENYENSPELDVPTLKFLYGDRNPADIEISKPYISNLQLTDTELNGNVNDLGYGQRTKVLILQMILSKCNVLVLDEPTKNLSPLSTPVLREILKNFGGVVISVSHDRNFIDTICNEKYELRPDGLFQLK